MMFAFLSGEISIVPHITMHLGPSLVGALSMLSVTTFSQHEALCHGYPHQQRYLIGLSNRVAL